MEGARAARVAMTMEAGGATGAVIGGIRWVVPAARITNGQLAELHPEWRMEAVARRTGVEARHWCEPHHTALDLGEAACRQLAAGTELDLGSVDALLFCTQSPDQIMPPNACLLQHRLGLRRAIAAFDFNLACSGYVYGLYLADSLIRSGSAQNVLLVTAETYSKWMHPDDRATRTVFGDAGAATWIKPGQQGMRAFVLGTDGAGGSAFEVPAGGARMPHSEETARAEAGASGNYRSLEQISMNGAAMLDFVKKEIPPLVTSILNRSGVTLADIDLVVFHQASRTTLDALNAALRIPAEKQLCDLAEYGNTVSASIPLALRRAEERGVLRAGMTLLLVGFGVGLSWGGCIATWHG